MTMPVRDDELLEVRVRGRLIFTLLFLLSHGAALAALWLSALPMSMMLLLSLILAVHAWQFSRRQLFLGHSESVLAVRYYNGRWYIQKHSGWYRVWPVGESLITPFLMTFRFRQEGRRGRSSVCLFSDTDHTRFLHALRLRLLLEGL